MGEAKRRKEQGLTPKTKKEKKINPSDIFSKFPRLALYLGVAFVVYLIYDVINYYSH